MKEDVVIVPGGDVVIDQELLDMPVSQITVRDLMKVITAVVVKKKSAFLSKKSAIREKILKYLEGCIDGVTLWDLSKGIGEEYSLVRYHMKIMTKEKLLTCEKVFDPIRRENILNIRSNIK